MKKIICDICGKEVIYKDGGLYDPETKYIAYPEYKIQHVIKEFGTADMDLCFDCAKNICNKIHNSIELNHNTLEDNNEKDNSST